MDTTIIYWGYIGKMEKNMETTIVYGGYVGIMEKKLETTIVSTVGCQFQGVYTGFRTPLKITIFGS